MKIRILLSIFMVINICCDDNIQTNLENSLKNALEAINNDNVQNWINIRNQIEKTKVQTIAAINMASNMRNWLIGKIVSENQGKNSWGTNFIEQLSKELNNKFHEGEGLSVVNIYRMKAFYESYFGYARKVSNVENLPVFHIPWRLNVILLHKLKNSEERLWYAQKILNHKWGTTTLQENIKLDLYNRNSENVESKI